MGKRIDVLQSHRTGRHVRGGIITLSMPAALLLTVFAAAPSLAQADSSATSRSPLALHLLRLEEELQRRPETIQDAARAELMLQHLRFLRLRIAREDGADARDWARRLRVLELRVRSVASGRLPRPVQLASSSSEAQGSIFGAVIRRSSGAPLGGIQVQLWSELSFDLAVTDESGAYRFSGLTPGRYFATTANEAGFIDQLYDDKPCPGGAFVGCDPFLGTPIDVADGELEVHFALDLGGAIAGVVTSASTGEGVSAGIRVWSSLGHVVGDGFTDAEGRYRVGGLPAGTYFVSTQSFSVYRDEVYDDLPCSFSCDPTAGRAVAVALESTTSGIDFALNRLGSISGTARDELTGDLILFMGFLAWDASGSFAAIGFSDEHGRYEIAGLHAGTYFVTTTNSYGFTDELYDGLPCPDGSCDPRTGTPIDVRLDEAVSGVDFLLAGGCVESETVLCLQDNRFRTEAQWRDFQGNSGRGQAQRLTPDTGYFWFFSSTNVEHLVKVLNACGLPNFHNFWVFAAGLTNVEVTLTVTDVRTRQSKQYRNPIGVAFQPIQDTAAFATCP